MYKVIISYLNQLLTNGVILLLFFSTSMLNAQVSVRTQLDTNYMLIGDQMQMNVQVNSSSDLKKVEGLFDQIDTSGAIEIIKETPWQKQADGYLNLILSLPSILGSII